MIFTRFDRVWCHSAESTCQASESMEIGSTVQLIDGVSERSWLSMGSLGIDLLTRRLGWRRLVFRHETRCIVVLGSIVCIASVSLFLALIVNLQA